MDHLKFLNLLIRLINDVHFRLNSLSESEFKRVKLGWFQFTFAKQAKMVSIQRKMRLIFLLTCASLLSAAAHTELQPLIFGGKRATENQFPFLVSLRAKIEGEFVHVCGASILSDRFLVTAGHCKQPNTQLDDYYISVGAYDKIDPGEKYTLKKFIVHPNHINHPISKMSNDIALLLLEKPIRFNKNTTTIEMNRNFIEPNVKAVVAGWGTSEV